MKPQRASTIGKRGTIVIPAVLRRRFGMAEGSLVLIEEHDSGVMIRPAAAYPVEIYTAERKAEFLLGSAVDAEDYERARKEVRALGLDPDRIQHEKPVALLRCIPSGCHVPPFMGNR